MPKELFQGLTPLIITLLFIWLLYRIKRRVANIVRDKLIRDFPDVMSAIDNLQKKINNLDSRIDRLEHSINELGRLK